MLQLYHNSHYYSVNIPKNDSFQSIDLSTTIVNTSCTCIINISNQQDCYLDNITVTLQ